MARMGAVRRAIKERLDSIVPDDLLVCAFVPDGITPPYVWIEPDRTNAEFQIQFQGGGTKLKLLITILTNRMDEESAQDYLDDFIDEDGPFVDGLQQSGPDYESAGISYVDALVAGSYGTYKVGDTYYFGVQIAIRVVT